MTLNLDSITASPAQIWREANCPSPLVVNPKDGMEFVYVPAGEFEMGDGQDSDCPKHTVQLSSYWISVYCVSNAQYLRFVAATNHRPPDEAVSGRPVWQGRQFPEDKAAHPVVCVEWNDAQAYAKWAGCQLPTEAQWEKAARGPAGLTYPWGNDWKPDNCRTDSNKGNQTTAPVAGYPAGISGYGTYQQSGNVSEWCADWFDWPDRSYYSRSPKADLTGPTTGSDRVLRGASWGSGGPAYYRAAHRLGSVLGFRLVYRGFRLVRSA